MHTKKFLENIAQSNIFGKILYTKAILIYKLNNNCIFHFIPYTNKKYNI